MAQPVEKLLWRAWPAKHAALQAWLCSLFLLISIVISSTVGPVFAIAMTIAILYGIGEFLLPSFYKLDPTGIRVRSLTRVTHRKWTDLQSWQPSRQGFYLVGKGKHRFLVKRRSLHLYCFAERDTVEKMLRQFLGPPYAAATNR